MREGRQGPQRLHLPLEERGHRRRGAAGGGSYFESRFRYVAVRRGKAVVVYGEDGNFTSKLANGHFRGLERDAGKMAAKVCGLPGVC
nr:hypothetical protein GCM10020093_058620 [Planobispora longispora]